MVDLEALFADERWCVVGGVAASAYMPERFTKDVDVLIAPESREAVGQKLLNSGWQRMGTLAFPSSSLDLAGDIWTKKDVEIDLISSGQQWAREALARATIDSSGVRVVPLAYLVLMKLDAARSVDQGDLSRMLARVTDSEVEQISSIVSQHLDDPQVCEDLRQYAQLGRWELHADARDS